MTGTQLDLAEVETIALDPPTLSADIEERQAGAPPAWPQDSLPCRGRLVTKPAWLHPGDPMPDALAAARACDQERNIVSTPVITRADDIAALDLVEGLDGDGELVDHLLASLRAFLTVD
jgi:hypothetical protein